MTSIGFLLDDTARLFRRSFNSRTRDTGITALQYRLMVYLRRNQGIRQGEMAELIEVEPITLSRMIDRLAEAAVVERRTDKSDRRALRLYLTPRGADLLEEVGAVTSAVTREATEGLTDAEKDRLLTLVDQVRANLSRKDPE